ncbi:hypothetical protein EMIT079MI2_310022 [Bacillus sp. IT-79MI2]
MLYSHELILFINKTSNKHLINYSIRSLLFIQQTGALVEEELNNFIIDF